MIDEASPLVLNPTFQTAGLRSNRLQTIGKLDLDTPSSRLLHALLLHSASLLYIPIRKSRAISHMLFSSSPRRVDSCSKTSRNRCFT